jgi:hypothetical protein
LLPIYEFSCLKKIKLLPKLAAQFTKVAAQKNKSSATQINNFAAHL